MSSPVSPSAFYRKQSQNGVEFEVQATILAYETEISVRKTHVTFWIHSRNSKVNRNEERPTRTSELLPCLHNIAV